MSQVRKLLQGNKIPKAQDGYKFQLDSQDVYFTDDDLAEIDRKISALPMDYRRFLGNATTAIKSGNESGSRAENSVTLNQLSNLRKGDVRRLEKMRGSYLESIIKPDSYAAKEAINEYLNILYSVANKRATKEKLGKDDLSLVFNQGEDGKYSLSTTAGDNYKARTRVLDVLASNGADKNYKYDMSDWDLGWLPGWMSSLPGEDKAKAARDYVDNLWTRMASGYDPKLSPDDENFLKNFYITFGFNNPRTTGSTSGSSEGNTSGYTGSSKPIVDENGNVDYDRRQSNGAFVTYEGKDGSLHVNSKEGDIKPYLFSSKERLMRYGLSDDYLNSVLYKGRIYKPSEITPETNIDLYNRMQAVITKNNGARNPEELHQTLSELIDYTDYDPTAYTYYNPEQHFWNDSAIRNALGRTGNYGIFNASPAYSGAQSVYGVYDFNTPGTNEWGFRAPFYLIIDDEGNIRLNANDEPRWAELPEDITYIPNTEYGAGPGFGTWESINNGNYAIAREIPAAESSRPPYIIYEDFDGNWYYNNSSRGLILLDPDLKQWLQAGNRPNPSQMENGTLNGKSKSKRNGSDGRGGNTSVNAPVNASGGGRGGSRKEGGLIPVKPLPKYQMGAAMLVKKEAEPVFTPSQNHDPLSASIKISDATNAEDFWNALSSAEKEEIIATSIDLGGAVAGLTGPVGSVAGAVTGLGSTGMFLDAAKKRKGSLDWGDYGQAALSTLLDVVSVLPWVGEAGKVAKIGKSIQKVAAPLGKIFTLMGLSAAASVVTKPTNEWTTDDLVKLSSGLQALTNIGAGFRVGRGESRLASRLSTDAKPEAPVYKSAKDYTVTTQKTETVGKKGNKTRTVDIEEKQKITLDDDDVNSIVNGEKPAGETLRTILRDKYKVKEADIATDDKALLDEFGFDTKTHRRFGIFGKRTVEANEVTPEKPEKYSKYGYLLDPVRLRNPEIRRREYIDRRLASDPELVTQLGPKKTLVSEQVGPREEIRTYSTESPLGRSERRAYISSLTRLGRMQPGTWSFRRPIDEGIGETTEINRSGEMKARDIVHEYENTGVEPSAFHEEAVQMGREYPRVHADAIKDDLIYSVRAATKPADKPKASPSARLGAEAVSNKELVSYILGNQEEAGLGSREAVAFLKGLTDSKRKSVLNALRNSGDKKGIEIANYFTEEGSQKTAGDKLKRGTEHVSKAVEKLKERSESSGGRKERRLKEMAANLEELRNSKDPMKTLSKLASSERAKALANENPTEHREALNQSLRDAVYSKLTGLRLDRYLGRVQKQMKNDGLQFKHGGVLKFKEGSGGGWHAKVGKWYDKLPLIAELADLGVNIHYNNKAFDALQRGAQETIIHKQSPTVINPALDNSAYERQLQNIRNERMSNVQDSTSDVVLNNALKNQRDAQLYERESALVSGINQNNVAYQNKLAENATLQNQWDTNVANDWLASKAAGNSAIQQIEGQRQLLNGKNISNLLMWVKRGIAKDNEKLDTAGAFALSQKQLKQKNQFFIINFPQYYEEYNALPESEKLKYTDISDYIQIKYPADWEKHRSEYERLEQNQIQETYDFQTRTSLIPNIPASASTLDVSYKKGGRLRGTTRYRNEPDEQVWIDSNKAVHAAVAKLQDNTIKLLLRALK